MTPNFGDFAEDATVYIPFNTFSGSPSASVTATNLVDADIKVHKDGSLTQIVTDGASVIIDFDGITGNHLITIDTSVHIDYTAGSDYMVRIEGVTVDGGTINAFVGSFSIENRYSLPAPSAADIRAEIDGTSTMLAAILADTTEIQTDWANGGRLDLILDSRMSESSIDTTAGAIDNVTLVGTTTTNTDMVDVSGLATAASISALNDIAATDIVTNGAITTASGAVSNVTLVGTTTTNTDMVDVSGLATPTQVAAELLAALSTDTYGEPTGVPSSTASIEEKIGYLYMALRNQVSVTGTKKQFFDDAGNVEWEKDLSDDDTTYSETKGNAP